MALTADGIHDCLFGLSLRRCTKVLVGRQPQVSVRNHNYSVRHASHSGMQRGGSPAANPPCFCLLLTIKSAGPQGTTEMRVKPSSTGGRYQFARHLQQAPLPGPCALLLAFRSRHTSSETSRNTASTSQPHFCPISRYGRLSSGVRLVASIYVTERLIAQPLFLRRNTAARLEHLHVNRLIGLVIRQSAA